MSGRKRFIVDSAGPSTKRRHKTLSIQQKIEVLKKLDAGSTAKQLSEVYDVGIQTIYDIRKNKQSLCKFFSEADSKDSMNVRKTMKTGKVSDLETVLMQWFRLRRSEGVSITGQMLIEQAKIFSAEFDTPTDCDFSQGWLQRFKHRHGISQFSVCGEKLSADQEAADKFVVDFNKLIADTKLTPEQVYNADETALYWRCMPKNTLATAEDTCSGMKENKDRVTVLACSNAAGTHKLKLFVVGKSNKPRAFKGMKVFPVDYRASKKAWVTTTLTTEWFDSFVRQARQHCNSIGLEKNCRILLLLDNCSAHSCAQTLEKDNVSVLYLPPNCTSLIQPQDQGILRSLKCKYRTEFLRNFLSNVNSGKSVVEMMKSYNLKDVIWALARAWDTIPLSTLNNAWHKIWPSIVFHENDCSEKPEFRGFKISQEKKMVNDLLEYAKNVVSPVVYELTAEDIEEWIDVDNDAPVVNHLTDQEIFDMAMNKEVPGDSGEEDEEAVDDPAEENLSIDDCIALTGRLISSLEKRSFITPQQIMNLYVLQSHLMQEKPKHMKQRRISEMFAAMNVPSCSSKPAACENPTVTPGTSTSDI